MSLFLNASPLHPVRARVRYLAHDSVSRPDGTYAYRLRATIEGGTAHRVGLKGTARVDGGRVPLIYWIFRRPWAAVRICPPRFSTASRSRQTSEATRGAPKTSA